MSIAIQKQIHRYREQASGYQWGEGNLDECKQIWIEKVFCFEPVKFEMSMRRS